MELNPGTQLGPYEILSLIGAGGMAEVYRARDTRLGRTVAVKVLPPHLSADREWHQRFEREARIISNLNHPHICTLYDVGHQEGTYFLVMEYLEGETLERRLARAPLPLDQALSYAVEIADALDKAHRQGVTHRDLKPANIMLTREGVKLLDFGLAKLRRTEEIGGGAPGQSTRQGTLTKEHAIMGTLQYMPPEQLEGRETDSRTDIFAFGAVLYEMVTRRPAFRGRSEASLIAAIMEHEPASISELQPITPLALERVVKTCLAKNPEDRWQTAHDVKLELQWIAEAGSPLGVPAPVARRRKSRELAAWALAGLLLLAFVLAISLPRARPALPIVRSSILPPEHTFFGPWPMLALSPDGRWLAFVARNSEGKDILWVQRLEGRSAQLLPGTEDASYPFWSPDSRFLGFFAEQKLKKIEASGGPVQILCDAPTARTGAWNREGVILLAPAVDGGISRISEAGGAPTPATRLDSSRREFHHVWPHFLPDGRHFLYVARGRRTEGQGWRNSIYVGSLDSSETKLAVSAGAKAIYVPPGHLLYWQEGSILAQPFDAGSLRVTGEAFAVAEEVNYRRALEAGDFSASQNGVLAYWPAATVPRQLLWFDRAGRKIGSAGQPGYFRDVRLSPDGQRIAIVRYDPRTQDEDVWLYETARDSLSRFTFDPGGYYGFGWSPDGSKLLFGSDRNGPVNLYQKALDGSGGEELLLPSHSLQYPTDWSSDGRFVAYDQADPKTARDLWVLPLFGDRKPFPFQRTPFYELSANFSPDGRWVAYQSNESESGRTEIYVRPFTGPGKWKISTSGGRRPRWRRDGQELFYLGGSMDRQLMAVHLPGGSTFQAGVVRALFEAPAPVADFDVSADGQRLLINMLGQQTSPPITVVVNWNAGLRR